jgi:hypothetical protein
MNRATLSDYRQNEPAEAIVGAIDACLSALEQVDRNANLGILIQHWSEALTQPSGGQVTVSAF